MHNNYKGNKNINISYYMFVIVILPPQMREQRPCCEFVAGEDGHHMYQDKYT